MSWARALVAGLAAAFTLTASAERAWAEEFQRFYAGGAQYPESLATGPDGAVWFTWERGLGRLSRDGSVRLHRLAGVTPRHLAVGRDRALWFTDATAPRVGRFTLDGTATVLPVRDGGDRPFAAIAFAPDGTLWLGGSRPGRLLRLTTDGGATTAAQLGNETFVSWLLPLPNGDIWFAAGSEGIGRLSASGELRRSIPRFQRSRHSLSPRRLTRACGPRGRMTRSCASPRAG